MAENNEQVTMTNLPDDPQLSLNERAWAVAIVLSAMIFSLFIIIAWWPSNPTSDKTQVYYSEAFHVRPVVSAKSDSAKAASKASAADLNKKIAAFTTDINSLSKSKDSASIRKLATDKKELADNQLKLKEISNIPSGDYGEGLSGDHWTIQLGNLILILVAVCGFLGNLIHVSRSLTYYIGVKQFQRSWIPWYFIKPFTASGLALLIYFGTSSSTQAGPVNLFPTMLAAGLAGLFTDIATQKLKVIFEAILKPADTRPPGAQPAVNKPTVDVASITPVKIDPKVVNAIKIPGTNLNPKTIVVKINDNAVNKPNISPTLISFDYQPSGTDATKTEFELVITDGSSLKVQTTLKSA